MLRTKSPQKVVGGGKHICREMALLPLDVCVDLFPIFIVIAFTQNKAILTNSVRALMINEQNLIRLLENYKKKKIDNRALLALYSLTNKRQISELKLWSSPISTIDGYHIGITSLPRSIFTIKNGDGGEDGGIARHKALRDDSRLYTNWEDHSGNN
uniref:Uncharacterized protein n=1 Tax=Glossina pallidipes TaxID=7398 RepID=A0A1B0A8D7_GLOPL